MGLSLKDEGNNNPSGGLEQKSTDQNKIENNPWDIPKKSDNPWDAPTDTFKDLEMEEPKVVYNTQMAELYGKQKQGSPVVNTIKTIIIALVICGAVIGVGKGIVNIVMPKGIDITAHLELNEQEMATKLDEEFVDHPAWESSVDEYSKSKAVCKGSKDLGIIYMDGKPIGVHIPTDKYMIFHTRKGDGEKHVHTYTTYPYETFMSILNTMSERATVYIYYSEKRNDCIFFRINNTTNRVESMTYYSDYQKVTEELER